MCTLEPNYEKILEDMCSKCDLCHTKYYSDMETAPETTCPAGEVGDGTVYYDHINECFYCEEGMESLSCI